MNGIFHPHITQVFSYAHTISSHSMYMVQGSIFELTKYFICNIAQSHKLYPFEHLFYSGIRTILPLCLKQVLLLTPSEQIQEKYTFINFAVEKMLLCISAIAARHLTQWSLGINVSYSYVLRAELLSLYQNSLNENET